MWTMRGGFDTDLFQDSGDVRRRTSFEGAYLRGEAGTRRERRYGGFSGGDLGRAGRQLERVLPAVHKGGQAKDTEAAGLERRPHQRQRTAARLPILGSFLDKMLGDITRAETKHEQRPTRLRESNSTPPALPLPMREKTMSWARPSSVFRDQEQRRGQGAQRGQGGHGSRGGDLTRTKRPRTPPQRGPRARHRAGASKTE